MLCVRSSTFTYRQHHHHTAFTSSFGLKRFCTNHKMQQTTEKANSTTNNHNANDTNFLLMNPIGYIQSCFKEKNGTPRQGNVSVHSRGRLTLRSSLGTNPQHFLEGLVGFSHVYLLWIFHANNNAAVKAKVRPPRWEGDKIGVFATRTPHRPNPVGLSIAKVDKIENATIHLSGIDLVDGTPVIDIKPYMPFYDSIPSARVPQWLENPQRQNNITRVEFSDTAQQQLHDLLPKLQFYKNDMEAVKQAIEEVLLADPRSTYRKNKCVGEIYPFCLDIMNLQCQFVEDNSNDSDNSNNNTASSDSNNNNNNNRSDDSNNNREQPLSAQEADRNALNNSNSNTKSGNNNTRNQEEGKQHKRKRDSAQVREKVVVIEIEDWSHKYKSQ